jgi:hypothetical protein
MRRFAAFALALLLGGHACAGQFTFAALGDTPYTRDEEPQFVGMIAQMNRQPLAFVLHVGDFKDARSECSDALFRGRRDSFQLSHHAFFYTPGDNEWIDCRRAYWAPREPLERLAALRALFFARDSSLGQTPLSAQSQRARGYPENMQWRVENVVFATLNIPGPDNNRAMPHESGARTAAVIDWMADAFRVAREQKLPGVVLATQANIWNGNSGYARVLEALASEARSYAGEVLVIHGDTHWFRFDRPLIDPKTRRPVDNVTRLEVYGSPFVDWVQVTVRTQGGKVQFEATRGSNLLETMR